ncbi:hemolysin D [Pseudoalteromonas sp. JBTF-M23]|uniref:Hemolysin D n=1 Tax=Pseudoalteromonas caenipelagi TaxID=2726988 RepID=A0A849VIC5_9GAMM|nr:hemolysin D [Pseudoalteromonas caenipelagi]NOU51417.1 hemolysin D [Pseudoalteromonas caenipelagi]
MKKLSFCLAIAITASTNSLAFTQLGGSGIMPMGHEWLTRTSALELLDAEHIIAPDPNDPRPTWRYGLAKNTNLNAAYSEISKFTANINNNKSYQPRFDNVYAAIVGERWVDIAGFNVTNASTDLSGPNCFSAVSQEPADLQQDHFMRRFDDIGGQGGVEAARRAQQRFIQHFVDAAMAQNKRIKVWDGGGYSALTEVDHNYFLFGRAVHLFQDSFSPEHTVRLPADNYEKVWQVKAYLCSEGAEQHSHDTKDVLNFSSGDVIWKANTRLESGWDSYKVSSMKPVALVALEASKDLWAGFIRTMATHREERAAVARAEAQRLVDNWLSFDEQAMLNWYDNQQHRDHTYVLAPNESGVGKTLIECMLELNVGTDNQAQRVAELEAQRRQCLYNIEAEPGYEDLYDPHMNMPYNWRWKSLTWQTPPSDWQASQQLADKGQTVTFKSSLNAQPVQSDGPLQDGAKLITAPGEALEFIKVPTQDDAFYLRSKHQPELFFSYSASSSGYAKLVNSPRQAAYRLIYQGGVWNIKNTHWQQYFFLDEGSIYLNRHGNPQNTSAKWIVE